MTTKHKTLRAAIVPSDTQPIRKEPMTNDELFEQLARDRREIEEAGRPLIDPDWRNRRASIRKDER